MAIAHTTKNHTITFFGRDIFHDGKILIATSKRSDGIFFVNIFGHFTPKNYSL
jgi:hypothetical protein